MFEKISSAAEKLATNASESRRGFLVKMGKAALGLTGAVAGLLALSSQAQAGNLDGYCQVWPGYGLSGYCICQNPCRLKYNSTYCHPGASTNRTFYLCRDRAAPSFRCPC
jgi:hypothetical protein